MFCGQLSCLVNSYDIVESGNRFKWTRIQITQHDMVCIVIFCLKNLSYPFSKSFHFRIFFLVCYAVNWRVMKTGKMWERGKVNGKEKK